MKRLFADMFFLLQIRIPFANYLELFVYLATTSSRSRK